MCRSYDPIDNQWSEAIEGMKLPHEREKHNMVGVGHSKIYFLAGRDNNFQLQIIGLSHGRFVIDYIDNIIITIIIFQFCNA